MCVCVCVDLGSNHLCGDIVLLLKQLLNLLLLLLVVSGWILQKLHLCFLLDSTFEAGQEVPLCHDG